MTPRMKTCLHQPVATPMMLQIVVAVRRRRPRYHHGHNVSVGPRSVWMCSTDLISMVLSCVLSLGCDLLAHNPNLLAAWQPCRACQVSVTSCFDSYLGRQTSSTQFLGYTYCTQQPSKRCITRCYCRCVGQSRSVVRRWWATAGGCGH
eukprot:COSAG01_NODE_1733_length_9368_cov_6.908620_4_plen_148_part_00